MLYKLPYLVLLCTLLGCDYSGANFPGSGSRKMDYDTFGEYWYQGKAELNTYSLEQYRYGEKRNGEAVLIFVTEDFSIGKQVKLDDPQANEQDAQKVMKLNLTKKFLTGIYPYSMMLSVFTPVYDTIPAVKVTASSQEWCGHTFTQLNREQDTYRAQLFSYFEKESNQRMTIDAIPEDALWTLLRLNPSQLPTGNVRLIPGLLDQRLTHQQLEAEDATISTATAANSLAGFEASGLRVLTVKYKSYPRELRIFYTAAFPFTIAGWEEVRRVEGNGEEVSRAVRKASMRTDYWTKNKNEFEPLRQQLKLD